ncbi:hypothetical protein IQ268_15185 [Oculatella sp. LEGE 06141]|uniref:hypothetical protein n=1 Tax=Oculatella sp. LEGE 06141 TaxID=1828648 RepID=UPI00187E624E|nr:hypothetical protein [Oculatella sp. LEGE 06141]MBE9179914.1 hypothetical protein [Oculatella sp. LEGE 06141]
MTYLNHSFDVEDRTRQQLRNALFLTFPNSPIFKLLWLTNFDSTKKRSPHAERSLQGYLR